MEKRYGKSSFFILRCIKAWKLFLREKIEFYFRRLWRTAFLRGSKFVLKSFFKGAKKWNLWSVKVFASSLFLNISQTLKIFYFVNISENFFIENQQTRKNLWRFREILFITFCKQKSPICEIFSTFSDIVAWKRENVCYENSQQATRIISMTIRKNCCWFSKFEFF